MKELKICRGNKILGSFLANFMGPINMMKLTEEWEHIPADAWLGDRAWKMASKSFINWIRREVRCAA